MYGDSPGFLALQVLTFDFHNTLAHCDRWFELEVRSMPREVATRLDVLDGRDPGRLDVAYRELRQGVIASGIEVDAYEGVERVFERTGVRAGRADIRVTVDRLMREAMADLIPVDGAIDTVRDLHGADVRLGIVSSAVHHDFLEWTLDRFGISGCFTTIVTSARSGLYKSTPAIFTHSLELLGGTAVSSVHVGDSLRWDIAVAREAGLNPVWLQTPRKEVFGTGAVHAEPMLTLTSLVDAGPVLHGLLGRLRERGDD